MTIDNGMYDRLAGTWWDDSNPLAFLRTAINPVRVQYFREVLVERRRLKPSQLQLLDVGCGGGFLAEAFARLGCQVTGVDPSGPAIEVAAAHARASGLAIDYRVGTGEQLPAGDGCFDVVSCCDVLEHVADLDAVISEMARVVRPGGVFLYDTINRTLPSKVAVIKVAQEWPLTRIVPQHLHEWQMFITPSELETALERHGLRSCESVGIAPKSNPVFLLGSLIALKRGKISFAQLGERMAMRRSSDLSVSYMGYAVRPETGGA
jgi:2-polyprenyl-6-hydroxyphenyl methylase/3-demethylubiquinone-9 3-methyltransferase